jgi:MFS-type transporter involved in bile tolerance (Atg22 family)
MGIFYDTYNLTGLAIGLAAFAIIALGRYTTIIAEYYFTKKFWIGFLIIGILGLASSLVVPSFVLSSVLSILGFTYLWGIGEIIEQEERVKKGWFPENPKRRRRS